MMVLLWPGMEELVSLLKLVPISPLGRGALKDFPFSILTFYTVRIFLTIHIHTYVHIYIHIYKSCHVVFKNYSSLFF